MADFGAYRATHEPSQSSLSRPSRVSVTARRDALTRAQIKPRFNPEVPPARLPFRPTEKNDGDLVLSVVGDFTRCRRDAQCRCRKCKEPLI